MPLTPADVHNVAFSKPPIGKRGYNEDEVDQFLDLVEDTLAEIQEENDELRQVVEELRAELETARSAQPAATPSAGKPAVDEAALRKDIEASVKAEYEAKLAEANAKATKAQNDLATAKTEHQKALQAAQQKSTTAPAAAAATAAAAMSGSDAQVQAAKVLTMAQEMADRLTAEAQVDSQTMLDKAHATAEARVSEANATATRLVNEAQVKSERQLAEADATAKRLVEEAQKSSEQTLQEAQARAAAQIKAAEDKANALQADAERKHTEIMATVKQQQTSLETRISELRIFEREYRTRLKDLLTTQLEELEQRGTAYPAQNGH